MTLRLREARFPADYAAMAAVLSAVYPEWPRTAQDLERDDAKRDPRYHWKVFLAEEDGEVVGVASTGHLSAAHREGRFGIRLSVLPERRNRGIGSLMYDRVLEHLRGLGARELLCSLDERRGEALAFARRRGFAEYWRMFESRLDPRAFDFAPYALLEQRLGAEGYTLSTYAELADPQGEQKFYELHWQLMQDIPMDEPPQREPLEQWREQWTQNPRALPEACYVALKDGQWVGISNLWAYDGYYLIALTGVLREHRGRSLALALKLAGIRYALEHGGLEIRTFNDSPNQAMLGLNRKLGFVPQAATIHMRKTLAAAP